MQLRQPLKGAVLNLHTSLENTQQTPRKKRHNAILRFYQETLKERAPVRQRLWFGTCAVRLQIPDRNRVCVCVCECVSLFFSR